MRSSHYRLSFKMIKQFEKTVFHQLCNELAAKDIDLKHIIDTYSYPPFWIRPNTFETVVLTILEQQVSLASAYAGLQKTERKIRQAYPKKYFKLNR